MIIASPKSKLQSDFNSFVRNGNYKTRSLEVVAEVLKTNQQRALQMLKCETLYLSLDGITLKITSSEEDVDKELSSDQVEADTKIILHRHHAL